MPNFSPECFYFFSFSPFGVNFGSKGPNFKKEKHARLKFDTKNTKRTKIEKVINAGLKLNTA